MKTGAAEKYRNSGLTVIRGEQAPFRGRRRGPRWRTAAELFLDQRMHTAAVAIHGRDGTTPSVGWEDIRRRRQHPWRVIARRIVEAHAAGASLASVLEMVSALQSWTEQLYVTNGETVTERVTLFQSARSVA